MGSQPMGWCYPQLTLFWKHPHGHAQNWVSIVILNPTKSTANMSPQKHIESSGRAKVVDRLI